MNRLTTVVVSHHWREPQAELAFLSRSLAAAATRFATVRVLTPGPPGLEPDGAFDVEGLGPHGHYCWPEGLPPDCVTLVDDLTPDMVELLAKVQLREVFHLAPGEGIPQSSWSKLSLVGDVDSDFVRVHVPVNPLAHQHRHNGFGFTGYVLVLSRHDVKEEPPAEVAWLTAGLPDRHVIVIEDATASAWKGRALRGRVAVDTRMDLWRLVAHAAVCVDLAPGPYFARECVEAMRFGTPIVVPANSGAAVTHARSGGGLTFADPYELLGCVAQLSAEENRQAVSDRARHYADANFGSPVRLVSTLKAKLEAH